MTGRPGDVLVFGAGELTLTDDAVLWFVHLAKQQRDAMRLGGRNDPDVERWCDAATLGARRILSARTSGAGTSDVPIAAIPAPLRMLDPVGSGEASKILGRTTREFTRLCSSGALSTASKDTGRWLADRGELIRRAERAS